MSEKLLNNDRIVKNADVGIVEVTDQVLAEINKHTLEPLTSDQVFVFKLLISDNSKDREDDIFTADTLKGLAPLFIGKTMIKDHMGKSDNQVARIFKTDVITSTDRFNEIGEAYTQLHAMVYMLKSVSNEPLIADIKAGIKKEVSLSVGVERVECSICGVNKRETYCEHWHGGTYDGKKCMFLYKDAKQAYEVSFVAVPANANAGVMKSLITEKPELETVQKDSTLDLELDIMAEFISLEKSKIQEDI